MSVVEDLGVTLDAFFLPHPLHSAHQLTITFATNYVLNLGNLHSLGQAWFPCPWATTIANSLVPCYQASSPSIQALLSSPKELHKEENIIAGLC